MHKKHFIPLISLLPFLPPFKGGFFVVRFAPTQNRFCVAVLSEAAFTLLRRTAAHLGNVLLFELGA
jgi:hypothetical protein